MNADQVIRKALSLAKKGKIEQATKLLREVLARFPANIRAKEGLHRLLEETNSNQSSHPPKKAVEEIIAFQKRGEFLISAKKSENLLENYPDSHFIWNLLGVSQKKAGKINGAIISYRKAISINSGYADAHFNLGNALMSKSDLDDAEKSFKQATRLQPNNAKFVYNLGYVLREKGKIDEAEKNVNLALSIFPKYAEAFFLLAQIYDDQARFTESVEAYRKAIKSKTSYPEAHVNLSNILWKLGKQDDAISTLGEVISMNPRLFDAASKRVYFLASKNNCGTDLYLDEVKRLNKSLDGNSASQFVFEKKYHSNDRIRLGFVSADFRDHPVGYFLENLLKNLNKKKLECLAFSNSPEETSLTQRIKSQFKEWHSIYGVRDADAASLIYNAKPDVLIDLSGHTGGNRLPVFSLRPAPIQATWLGYFASTGIDTMDFIIGDKFVTPFESQNEFTEKIIQLPDCYLCFSEPDFNVKIGPTPAAKNNYITFGCLNRADKISKELINVWSQILKRVPNSQLLFRGGGYNSEIESTITRVFEGLGVNKNRLKFAEMTGRKKFLGSYNQIDIALDPFPYPGGTSTCEALWMGVPVITKKGFNFLSRMGETILHNTGNEELCAKNNEEYVDYAVELTKDIPYLNKKRANRREQILKTRIFDAKSFASDFENMIFEMLNMRIKK